MPPLGLLYIGAILEKEEEDSSAKIQEAVEVEWEGDKFDRVFRFEDLIHMCELGEGGEVVLRIGGEMEPIGVCDEDFTFLSMPFRKD